jgi:hypothetical protein
MNWKDMLEEDARTILLNPEEGAEWIFYDGREILARTRRTGEMERQTGVVSWEMEIEVLRSDVGVFREAVPVILTTTRYRTTRVLMEGDVLMKIGLVRWA